MSARAAWLVCAVLALASPRALGQERPVWSPNSGLAAEWTTGELSARVQRVRDLGAPERGLQGAAERARELALIARSAGDKALRDAALETLALVEGPAAADALAALVRGLAPEDDLRAAEGLVARSDVGAALLELLRQALGPEPAHLREAVLVELLDGFPKAFAAVGTNADAAALVAARLHPATVVREAADTALNATLDRLGSLRADARALALLEQAVGGWSTVELDLLGALYLVRAGRDLPRAEVLAERTWAATEGATGWEPVRNRFLARYFQAAAQLGQDECEAAYHTLQAASVVLEGAIGTRPDLRPEPVRPSKHGGLVAHDFLLLRGLVELMAAHAAVGHGASASDAVVLRHLRNAHEFSLWAQLRRLTTNDQAGVESLDDLFDHNLAPRRLVFSAPDNPVWSGPGRDRGLDVLLAIGRAAAVIGGEEVPGFRPLGAVAEGFGPPRDDPRRAMLLKLMQPAQLTAVQRRLNQSWDQAEMQILEIRRRILSEDIQRAITEDYPNLEAQRIPSLYALTIASDLGRENRAEEAVELVQRLFDDMDANGRLDEGANGSWLAARIELELGGALGEAGRPRDAVGVLESAVRRLEAIENTLIERRGEEQDARRLQLYDAQVKQTQQLQAQVLVGLAVNANVRLGDPETALAFFERAFELDDSEFMRGLLACYRARFGAQEEARQLLRTIRPAPPVYYNLACAYALLGEADQALDMLARELQENHPTPGALARQKRWAREDPDLASLVDDPRFVELTRP